MAVKSPFPMEFGALFPLGAGVVGEVSPVFVFDEKAPRDAPKIQERDKDSGLPLWQVDVMDFDPEAKERTFRVKLAAEVQPVPPAAVAGLPVRPVVLEGLALATYVKKSGDKYYKVAYSLKATGLAAPKPGRGHGEDQGKAA